jgi:NifB/MoaA-like Fe-S oxidoreductase
LLTGQDLLRGLQGKDLGNAIVLPSLMLKNDDTRFLDDMTVEDVARQLRIQILPVNGTEELIETCIKSN